MRLAAGAAVVLAVGAGLGTYFGLRGSAEPPVPKVQRSAVLDRATAEGVIGGYRVDGSGYRVTGAGIRLHALRFRCVHGPACLAPKPTLFIEYRARAAREAEAIYRIAQQQMPNAHIKFFETTTLGG